MKTILFVDDEKNILNALKRVFRSLEFNCRFAQNIAEAIAVLIEEPVIDMLVTDIKMPHFDGLRVLKVFKEASPETVRVALTGYASTGSITEAVSKNLAKQYFHKPWDNEDLVRSIRKMFQLEETLEAFHLFKEAQKFEGVKTIPKLFHELNAAISRDKSVEYITDLVSKDPAIATNILRIANSAFYAARTGDLQQAIMYIGLNNLKQIVLTYEVSQISDQNYEKSAFIWTHSTRTNKIFQELYEMHFNKKIPGIISTAGLMHDIGKIIMLQIFGATYYNRILKEKGHILEKERALYGVDHCLVGGYFLNWWAFPIDLIEMTMYHHDPTHENINNRELVAMMCVASDLESYGDGIMSDAFVSALAHLNISQNHLDTLFEKYVKEA